MKTGSMLKLFGYRSRKQLARIVHIELLQGHVMWPTSAIGSQEQRGQGRNVAPRSFDGEIREISNRIPENPLT
jgi:hypothetical protein